MIQDMIKRSKTDYKEEHILKALEDNYSIINEEGFAIFNVVQDELHILFLYVVPGYNGKLWAEALESIARSNGLRKMKFITKRDKAFARRFPDYKPTAVMFEKNIE